MIEINNIKNMSGHSKWSQIKHKKGVADQKKAKVFSKLARVITIAAKTKGQDPSLNPQLRSAIEKAQEMNMPKDNIERAIEKAQNQNAQNIEETILEAYGPEGIAVLIKTITDNKNRTIQEVRSVLNEYGGKMAQEGSVKWLFNYFGAITVDEKNISQEEIELNAIEAGAQDIIQKENTTIILTKPEDLDVIKKKLIEKKINIISSELEYIAKNYIELNNQNSVEKIAGFFDSLDENEDVQEIYSNIKL